MAKDISSTKVHSEKSKTSLKAKQMMQALKKEIKQKKEFFGMSFHTFPKKINFESQNYKEEIILLLRRHMVTNISWILLSVFMLFVPILLRWIPLIDFLPSRFQFVTILLWYLMILAYVLEKFLSWYFNVYLFTDERLVDVDFYSLIYKRITEAKIDRIEDISYSQGGLLQSLFDYGTVRVQTASEVPELEFELIPHPGFVTKILNQLILQEQQEEIEGRAY